ncbi:DNA primase large subunit isoform X1 [Nasonia vitripennis]|uniref:DNA primase large subunit n=2 Tax=Nasonia vitripennis TaxID=7425 RepID=A0A7M7H4Z0_NASVI|nr:DNA primase large subunit isoform X1 [Nasonia vitripennis]
MFIVIKGKCSKMDYTPKRRRTHKPEKSALLEAYPHDLQLYKVPPIGQISLVEFQDLALERQKVLQLLELTLAQQHKSIDEIKLAFTSALKKEGYHAYARLVNALGCSSHTDVDLEARRRDHIAHFVLRLAYSLKDDLQNYMLTYETELFKLRFHSLNREGLTQFLATSGLHYSPVSQEFKEQNRENLYMSTAKEGDFENTDFYELPFDKVVDLISDRKVYLHKGIAYVPQNDLITVFLTHFRTNLSIELNKARKFVLNNLDDERLQSFLKSLPECFTGMAKVVWNSQNVPIAKLNDLSKTSYPLCMRIMHEHLTTNHHLKNTGRLQYGLFLKGVGVTLEDSIEFWKSEMTKKEDCNEDKFNKQYLYQIRYNYGKVGRRVDYRPAGCNKLISEPVGPAEVHGCPYKHMDTDELTKKLLECHLPHSDVGEITKLASEGHYILACTRYFESTHKQPPARMFLHPNHYFQESRNILTIDEVKEETAVQDTYMPLSPEKISQSIKVKVENNLDTSNSVTPSRQIEKKVRTLDKKDKMDPTNIEALLNDDSD